MMSPHLQLKNSNVTITASLPTKLVKRPGVCGDGGHHYHGKLSDCKQSLRFVGFASTQQNILHDFLEKRGSVEIRNRQIKGSDRDPDKLKVLVKGATKIHASLKKFDVPEIEFRSTGTTDITLNQVDKTPVYTIINVDV